MDEQITRLRNSQYGLFLIGHNKIKTLETRGGEQFTTLTSNLEVDTFGVFSYRAPIVCNIDVERSVSDVDGAKHVSSQRYMYFRSDGFIDAGSRFADIEAKVPFGATNYINAIQEGIRKASKFEGTTVEFRKKEEADRQAKIEAGEKLKEREIKQEKIEVREKLVAELLDLLKTTSPEAKDKAKDFFSNSGFSTATEFLAKADIDQLNQVISILGK